MASVSRCSMCPARQAGSERHQPLQAAKPLHLCFPASAAGRKHRRFSTQTQAVQGPASGTGPIHGPVDTDTLPGYTPFKFVSFSDEWSKHEISVTVQSDAQTCFDAWADRDNHFEFLTLAENIAYDTPDSDLAIYMLFYRWAQLPAIQMICDVRRTKIVPGELIAFENSGDEKLESELPLSGEVVFQDAGAGATVVTLNISIGLPNVLVDHVGVALLEQNLNLLLADNMDRFKTLVEK